MRSILFVSCVLAVAAVAQTKSPVSEGILKGKLAAPAAPPQIVKAADGKWRCMAGAQPCTEPQIQALQRATKTRSNIQNNFTVNSDGSVTCTSAGKACSDAEIQNTAAEMSKAITKGGTQ